MVAEAQGPQPHQTGAGVESWHACCASAIQLATFVSNFCTLQPAHVLSQEHSLAWLASAHTQAEATRALENRTTFDEAAFLAYINHRLARFSCGPRQIATRGVELDDCTHQQFARMQIYQVDRCSTGAGMGVRTRKFDESARAAFMRLYSDSDAAPDDLLHVTCTGYVSPSAAQFLVARNGWGDHTRVTHVYQMGCYAALPALRLASSLATSSKAGRLHRADIVHTEICSLHFQPRLHAPEQLIIQSLFADGFIRYSISGREPDRAPGFAILSEHERVLADSDELMTWEPSDSGMRMTLARDVPERLASHVVNFTRELAKRAGLTDLERQRAHYAIHPGGPKILEKVLTILDLEEAQISLSREVLRTRGNMSSATLPHIWMRLLASETVPTDAVIISLAFGPGLTLCGNVMRKVTPS